MVNRTFKLGDLAFRMSRPPVAAILLLFAFIGAVQIDQPLAVSWNLLLMSIIVVSLLINASSLNDLADEEIDRINLLGSTARPLANQQATRLQVWGLAAISAAVALAAGAAAGHYLVLIVAAGLGLNFVYSQAPFKISHRGLLAPLLLPVAYLLVPFLVGSLIAGNDFNNNRMLLLAGLYLCFIGRILLKDFRDVKGDAKFGKNTFLLLHGRRTTCISSAAFWLLGVITISLASPVLGIISALYLPFIFAGLYCLEQTQQQADQQVIIWSIARIGTAVAITTFAFLQLEGKPLLNLMAASAAIALPFIGLYLSAMQVMLKNSRFRWAPATYRIAVHVSRILPKPLPNSSW